MKFNLIWVLLLATGCTAKIIPLKGNYPVPPFTLTTPTNTEKVWSNLIDYVSQNGMSIKIIDKTSGLLVTEDYSFAYTYTHEEKGGRLADATAYLVTSRVKFPSNTVSMGPDYVTGNWNIRIKPEGDGSSITVSLTNVKTYNNQNNSRGAPQRTEASYEVRSTGKFENILINNIK